MKKKDNYRIFSEFVDKIKKTHLYDANLSTI